MSPRQDTYLSLCLEQASKSPLHYRHGCIIVRGGKVIGRGFNHYRPGFNGGALKNGRTKESPQLTKHKVNQKHNSGSMNEPLSKYGGGVDANMALSMHSEMMAIRSALSLSSHDCGASARSTAWYDAPPFKLPGHDKREYKLRREKIRQYVERVCEAAEKSEGKIDSGTLLAQNDMWRFEPGACGLDQVQQQYSQRANEENEKEFEGEKERGQEASDFFNPAQPSSLSISVRVS